MCARAPAMGSAGSSTRNDAHGTPPVPVVQTNERHAERAAARAALIACGGGSSSGAQAADDEHLMERCRRAMWLHRSCTNTKSFVSDAVDRATGAAAAAADAKEEGNDERERRSLEPLWSVLAAPVEQYCVAFLRSKRCLRGPG